MQPWDKQPDETELSYTRFCLYRDMGVQRTLDKVAELCNVTSATTRKQSQQNDWVARAKAYDRMQRDSFIDSIDSEFKEQRLKAREMRQSIVTELASRLKAVLDDTRNVPIDINELDKVARAAERILNQSRQEFNDLPTQRGEVEHGNHEIRVVYVDDD